MLLDFALQYAARGWRVFPVHTTISGQCSCGRDCGKDAGKHPRIKAWQKNATTDRAQIEAWWARWPESNIGIACGGGIVVTDLDGPAEIETFRQLAVPHGGLPETLVAATARGFHIYLAGDWPTTKKVPNAKGILVRGQGGYVVAPPSFHASGIPYSWAKQAVLAPMPDWFREWLQTSDNTSVTSGFSQTLLASKPAYLKPQNSQQSQGTITKRAKAGLREVPQTEAEMKRLASALATIPANCARDPWLHVGMALHALHWDRSDGTDLGFEMWRAWSETGGDKFQGLHDLETRWRSFGRREGVGLGTLYHIAEQHGWAGNLPPMVETIIPPPSPRLPDGPLFELPGQHANGHASATATLPEALTTPSAEHPLIMLNQKYACIGDLGGKCMVLGWVPSKVDPANEIPSFQTFKSFAERYGHRYVMIPKGGKFDDNGDPVMEAKQLGAHWLKWGKRRSFDGIDLVPGAGPLISGNVMNLWRGFATPAAPGSWDRMKAHIGEVLADGDGAAFEYILKWSAWAVQNPGERAESALVFRGGKGSGKGTFAHALRRMFGAHGLHISNPKHLVGAFNAHLRNCLLLYADEAFWAGDTQGESTLKALITESTLTIEQKGVDAVQWHNRIHLIMTANADWVVPASHDERRYAVFNVSEKYMENENYFKALYTELEAGGLAAMLWDLQHVDLKGWHPRKIIKTQALTEQKMQSMNPLQEWWEQMLQEGAIPAAPKDSPDSAMAVYLLNHAREFAPRLRELTPTRLGRFLSDHGCVKLHRASGNAWRFPILQEAREKWAKRYQGWSWSFEVREWQTRV